MYSREQLAAYPYFASELQNKSVSDLLDPSTGLVTRHFIIGFANYLIEHEIPFTVGMIDLDNFKYVNDTYGHMAGDAVLAGVADSLIRFMDGYGIVGRLGGDEYLYVDLRNIAYADKKQFCVGMYQSGKVLRRTYKTGELELFVTGTTGLASFPADGDTYGNLFHRIDIALYRGKSKGRNCYIIYMAEKHAGIEIRKMKKTLQYEAMRTLAAAFDSATSVQEKRQALYECFAQMFHISDLYHAGKDGVFYSVRTGRKIGMAEDMNVLTEEGICTSRLPFRNLQEKAPEFCRMLGENEFETMMIAPVASGGNPCGYLMWAEPNSMRIWQDTEMASLFFAARMMESCCSAAE